MAAEVGWISVVMALKVSLFLSERGKNDVSTKVILLPSSPHLRFPLFIAEKQKVEEIIP